MGEKTLVVHSGTFKTGTSSTQLFLSRAEESGTLPPGVSYPRLGRGPNAVAHNNLVADVAGWASFTPSLGGWEDLVARIASGDESTTVVSSENFSLLDNVQVARIGEYARRAGATVRWIHYLRDQASFYNAFYVERLMVMRPEFAHLVNRPFEEFRDWSPLDMGFLSYSGFAETILREIPGVDLRLRPYARDQLRGRDSTSDFCHTAGIAVDASAATQTNVGKGWQTVETARRLTPLVRKARLGQRVKDAGNPAALRMRWVQLVRTSLVDATTALGWNHESAMYLRPDFRDQLRQEYHQDNVRVGELGGFPFAEIVANTPTRPYNIGHYDDIPADELLQVVSAVSDVLITMPDRIAEQLAPRPSPEPAPAGGRLQKLVRRLTGS